MHQCGPLTNSNRLAKQQYLKRKPMGADLQLDFRAWGNKLVSYWWLFALLLMLSVAGGQFYLRYATPLYATKAKLLIKGVGTNGNLSETQILSQSMGLSEGGKDMDNEIQILMSRPIITKTVERIGANITYLRHGRIKDSELYRNSPIRLESYELAENRQQVTFYIKRGYSQEFEFRTNPEEEGTMHEYGKPLTNDYGRFVIRQVPQPNMPPGIYEVKVMKPDQVAGGFKNDLMVEVVGAKGSSSILELKLINRSPEKAEDFINTIIEVYNEEELNDNTQTLRNTVTFIDERLERLTNELNIVEGDIERFKSENEIITDKASGSLSFALVELRSSLASMASYEVQKELLKSVGDLLSAEGHNLIPTNIASVDPGLGTLMNEYNNVLMEERRLLESVTEDSPLIQSAQNRLYELKGLILLSLRNTQKDLEIPIRSTQNEIAELRRSLSSVPSVEQELVEKIRMQSIKESLFLFLLQKREETELSEAISTPNTRTIERARSSGGPIFPQKKLILISSILLGLLVPVIIVALIALMETSIQSEETVKGITTVPIVGRIPHKKGKGNFVITKTERSAVSEMFRFLRTNLNYLNIKNEKQVILITSSVTGEGKSVIAINLGLTIAMSHKKVVVLGMDLRMPKLASYLEVSDGPGVTTYLTGQCTLDDIIMPYQDHDHFHYINSGPVPPNPAELIMSDRMSELIEALKKDFDYILLDSPPVVVADALLLRKYATNTLFVVREKYTRKSSVAALEERYAGGELVKPAIILNDIKTPRRFNSPYYGAGNYINAS